ncbi:hypothetical protein GCM10010909_21100 [Acidocella aquatica]|uniref:Uncharacterized protein n=1 Tax=Acidocella aquatica TaxID=1922313 RepID=A0ABQ6A5I2_9PROT|nr:hypothetical protein [Acidocella aquatica]GLR67429.1 hypothetical protein GCM10010909_21100 [Acidocella aquatica]
MHVFKAYRDEGRVLPGTPPTALLQRMCDVAVGRPVPFEYLPMVAEELNFDRTDAKTVRWRKPVPRRHLDHFNVLVIGAGFSGIALGAKLKEAGFPFIIGEKNADVGVPGSRMLILASPWIRCKRCSMALLPRRYGI